MDLEDKKLLDVYMEGFRDELDGHVRTFEEKLLSRAYNLGREDALIGDDLSSVDNQTNEEILKKIKNM